MKNLILFAAGLLASSLVFADSAAAIFCTGKDVTLVSETNYMGENSSANQQLFILEKNDTAAIKLTLRGFFLDVELDVGSAKLGGAGSLVYTGKNEVGGHFQMIISAWDDVRDGDDSIIYQEAKGKITYKQGPLAAVDEAVTCVRK